METRTGIHVRNGVRQGSVPRVLTGYHLNSSRIVVDEDGTPVEGIAYHAYGKTDILLEAPSSGGENSVREKFTGKEHDLDGADDGLGVKGIALDYFGFRYYDAEVGVWTCADPAMEFYHGYSYVGGEPVTTVDPLGLSTFEEHMSALEDMAFDASGDDYAQDGSSIVLSGNDDDNIDQGGNQGGSNLDPDVSPLNVIVNSGGLSNSGGALGSHEPGTPSVNTTSSSDDGSLTEHNYTAEAMSGEPGAKGGVTSADIEKNKARAKEKSGEYTRAGSDAQFFRDRKEAIPMGASLGLQGLAGFAFETGREVQRVELFEIGRMAGKAKGMGVPFVAPKQLGPKIMRGAKAAGKFVAIGSVFYTSWDIHQNGLNTSRYLDLSFGVISLAGPIGGGVGAVYSITNLTTELASGRNLGQHMDSYLARHGAHMDWDF